MFFYIIQLLNRVYFQSEECLYLFILLSKKRTEIKIWFWKLVIKGSEGEESKNRVGTFSLLSFLTGHRAMPLDGGVSCLRRSEMIGIGIGELESPPLDSDQVHVLAVDDSLVDRIVIERLLRITSCKGLFVFFFFLKINK